MTVVAAFLLVVSCMISFAGGDWPDFRGPTMDGHAPSGAVLPTEWSETNHVKWKTAIHDKGWSTPVILNGQIWLTTATANGRDYYAVCADEATGKLLFDSKIFHCDTPEPLGNNLNCYASPSPVIEPGRVYVHFGSYGTACLDTVTHAILWKRDDLPCRHYRGPGSSPIIFENLLILSMDGIDVQYLVALDKETGKTVWKTDRTAEWNDAGPDGKPMGGGDYRKAFSTPLVIEGGKQMLSCGSKSVYSYDPRTGRELWTLRHPAYSPAARPMFENGIAYFATGNGKSEIIALPVDQKGEVPPAKVLWRASRAAPRMPSSVLVDGLIFSVNDGGIASCLVAKTGEEAWRERVGGEYAASVLYGGGRVYFFNQDGKATVVKAARAFEPVATNFLANGFMSSPAVSGNALFLRTKTDLYRIEN